MGRRIGQWIVDIVRSTKGGVTVIALTGSLTVMEAPGLDTVIKDISKDRPKIVAFDLAAVPHVDSSGIGALIKAMKTVKAFGGDMLLTGLSETVLKVFKVAGLGGFFRILTPEEFRRKYPSD